MIKEKIEYLEQTKAAIRTAIQNKGVAVQDNDTFRSYAGKIGQITGPSATQTLPEQTILIANAKYSPNGIELVWTDVGAAGYKIVRKSGGLGTGVQPPQNSADGEVVYTGVATTYTDTSVSVGNRYYYRIFPYNSAGQFQALEGQSIAQVDYRDRSGQTTVGDLGLGDTIKFGEFNGSLFTWKVVDTLDKEKGYITVAADQNLGNQQFDAPENASGNPNPVTNRKSQGNNRWLYSNVRQLLNASGEKNTWWVAQHEYDVKPGYASSLPGFLTDFTDFEKEIIVTKTNRCVLDAADGGGSETMQDKIWLPSSYATGLEISLRPFEDDHPYEAFEDNASRQYQSNWWLRTINGTTSASGVRIVFSSGALSNSAASSGNIAVRPFCLIPTSAFIAWSDSDNAYYFADDSQRNPAS